VSSDDVQRILAALAGIEGRLDGIEQKQAKIEADLAAVKGGDYCVFVQQRQGMVRQVIDRSIASLNAAQAQLERTVGELNDRLTVLAGIKTLDRLASEE
jgi:prefoldin subunit 5